MAREALTQRLFDHFMHLIVPIAKWRRRLIEEQAVRVVLDAAISLRVVHLQSKPRP